MVNLQLWWGKEQARSYYDSANLQDWDRDRAKSPRSALAQKQWETSRGLLQYADAHCHTYSLSHRQDSVLVGLMPPGLRLGVDLEWIKLRNVLALAPWCCDMNEQRWLQASPQALRLRRFYILWTVKEAFLKATNLAFPADMSRVGLMHVAGPHSGGHWQLRCDIADLQAQSWQAMSWWLDEGTHGRRDTGWVASAVWANPPGLDEVARQAVTWHSLPGDAIPRVRRCLRWQPFSPKIPAGNR